LTGIATIAKSGKSKKVCVYCGSEGPLTVEHVVPISRWREFGVKRRVLDNKSNKVAACVRCNSEKGSSPPREWFQLHPEYQDRFLSEARYLSDAVRRIAGLE
jgi:5-methylcytosine-specific restriction endonuclease McrA